MKKITFLTLIIISATTLGQNVDLINFKSFDCDEETDAFEAKNKIITKQHKKDTLVIKIGTTANCCTGFNPSVSFKKKNLILDFEEYGEYCNCICYYEFEYTIVGIRKKRYSVYLKNEKIFWKN